MALPEEKVDKDGCWSSKVDESYLLWLRFIGKWGLFQAFFWQLWPLWPLQFSLSSCSYCSLFPVLEVASEDSSLRQPEPKRHTIADHPRKSRLSFQIGQKEEAKLGAGLIQDDLYHQEARWTIGLVTRMRTLEDYQVDNITGNFFWMNTLLDRKNLKVRILHICFERLKSHDEKLFYDPIKNFIYFHYLQQYDIQISTGR